MSLIEAEMLSKTFKVPVKEPGLAGAVKHLLVEEGSANYKQLKENRKGMHCCEPCNDKIRLQAILNFFKN